MEIGKSGIFLDYANGALTLTALEGKVVLTAKAALALNPVLDKFAAEIESGAIDPIKGTEIDKTVLLKAVELIKAEINK